MSDCYPKPQDVNVRIPPTVREDWFCEGFEHALRGGQITQATQLRYSFREGYRAAKMYLRELRRSRGVLDLPMRAKMRLRAM